MAELPGGTVTFLFSDIESSTRLMRELGDDWEEALTAHNRLLRESFVEAGGQEVDRQGDAFFAVFPTARNAIAAAADAQRALDSHPWPQSADLRVRMGIHTGEPSVGGEGYLGVDVVRAARICSAASGGQVLVSETTRALVRGADLEDVGEHQLKDMEHPERLFQLVIPGLARATTAPRELDRPETAAPGELALRLERLGPAIERQVQDALARSALPPGRQQEIQQKLRKLDRYPAKPRSGLMFAGFVVLAVLAAVVAIVFLVIQAL